MVEVSTAEVGLIAGTLAVGPVEVALAGHVDN